MLLNYTSGTTGFSKGVMLTGNNLAGNVTFGIRTELLKKGDKVLSFLPLAHAYGCAFDFLTATAVGTHVTLLGKTPSPKIIMKAFEEVKPNLIITVPLVIEKIYKNVIQPLINKKGMKWALNIPLLDTQIYNQIRKKLIDALGGRFKEIIIGGAAMNQEVEEFFYKIKFPFTIGYGMTECGPLISYAPWNEFILGSSGKVLDIMEARIYKENPEAETLYPAVTRAAATDYSNPDRSFSSEVLFSLLNENKEDLYNTYFNSSNASSSNKLIPAAQRVQNLFGDDALSDYRYNWWEASNGIGETNLLMNVRLRKIADTDLVYGKLMPLIRVSEMYLIAAECATEEQTQYDYLNAHRLRRGNQVQVTTGLEGELAKEYSKEFLCEGQLWFYYKRTNTAKIQSGSSNTNITMSNAKYVPNLPDSEIKYRN